jgi:hypothetical protein
MGGRTNGTLSSSSTSSSSLDISSRSSFSFCARGMLVPSYMPHVM